MLPTWLHGQVFKHRPSPSLKTLRIAIEHLERQGIFDSYGVPLTPQPITQKLSVINEFKLPSLNGDTIAEHFWRIGENQMRPVRELAQRFASVSLPDIPAPGSWVFKSGWTRYEKGNLPKSVDFPNEEILCFDVETLVPDCPFSVLATAASPTAWYSWVSPRLIEHKKYREQGIENYEPAVKGYLIPIGTLNRERIIVGHNTSYDRARIKEEYHLKPSGTSFLDTMALHIAINGVCDGVPGWARAKWEANCTDMKNIYGVYDVSLVSGLSRVYQYHCNKQLDKSTRNIFVDGTMEEIVESEMFQNLMTYCAKDVEATHQVYQKVFPRFLEVCPHPVSFAGMLHMGNMFLSTTREDWVRYIKSADKMYTEKSSLLDNMLQVLAEEACKLDPAIAKKDHWLKQLDWNISNGRKKAGCPSWYRELWDSKTEKLKISPNCKIGIMLMKLTWKGFPIYYSKQYGYVYRVPIQDDEFIPTANTTPLCVFSKEDNDYDFFTGDIGGCYYQISKTFFLKYFYGEIENGTIRSTYEDVTTQLLNQVFCAYWKNKGPRMKTMMVAYNDHPQITDNMGLQKQQDEQEQTDETGIIIPQVLTIGTLMRRAIDRDWILAEELNENYVGADYRKKIKAPKGYKIVRGKIEALEIWIASLIGDSQFGIYGATAMSWHVLHGDPLIGTDMHSRTARELKVSRNQARLIDYGRIFGGNRTFGGNFMFVNNMLEKLKIKDDDLDTINKTINFYKKTEGNIFFKNQSQYFWHGGSESYTVNGFDDIDNNSYTNDIKSEDSRTPILKSGKPWGLRLVDKPVNWVVQSAAVDFQHLLLVSMQHLIKKYQINARLMLMEYDNMHFLCDQEECYRVALAMQISHFWTRSLFSYMMGIEDLPMSLAFFPSIEIRNQLDEKRNSEISRITMMDTLASLNEKDNNNSKETTTSLSLIALEKLLIKPLAKIDKENDDLSSSITIPQEEVESLLKPYCPPEDYDLFLELQSLTTEEEIKTLFKMRRMDGLAKMSDYIKRTYPSFFGKVERYFKFAV
ncbi:4554_t:CDS:2 [Ambispora gerdemannii]|uniref:Mitochondrial DNA polymerase catalytic subunit n=1 Tax=Ambispora gerdemannii TaxID=144530 RepID=A0A9N9AN54_9GLOM|nr:4554_t:CDS:2 [Ambispora gerdemannii]